MSQKQFYMKILKHPIDFRSFLKVAHGHALYGENTRGARGRAQKPVKNVIKCFATYFGF